MTAMTTGVTGAGSVAPETPVRRGRRGSGWWRWVVFAVLGVYFLVPLGASIWFTIRRKCTTSPDNRLRRRSPPP